MITCATPAHPVPAWPDHARELSEFWIHRPQILQALDRPSDLTPGPAGPVLDALRWAWPYRLSSSRTTPGDSLTIQVTAEVTRTWHLVATEDGWEYRGDPGSQPVATLTMTTDQAWRLLGQQVRDGLVGPHQMAILGAHLGVFEREGVRATRTSRGFL
jgi:hypothetical protein